MSRAPGKGWEDSQQTEPQAGRTRIFFSFCLTVISIFFYRKYELYILFEILGNSFLLKSGKKPKNQIRVIPNNFNVLNFNSHLKYCIN